MKVARPVRGRAVGKVLQSNSLAAYSTKPAGVVSTNVLVVRLRAQSRSLLLVRSGLEPVKPGVIAIELNMRSGKNIKNQH